MFAILRALAPGDYVLDLGCQQGSFPAEATPGIVIRLNLDEPRGPMHRNFVRGDAAKLPFGDLTFSAVIANHSLEHIEQLDACRAELGRVVRRDASVWVSVPDASTWTDRLYRWLNSGSNSGLNSGLNSGSCRGGGHVSAFVSAADLEWRIERAVGLPHVKTRELCSSLSFLNRQNAAGGTPRRALLVGVGWNGRCSYTSCSHAGSIGISGAGGARMAGRSGSGGAGIASSRKPCGRMFVFAAGPGVALPRCLRKGVFAVFCRF